MVELPSGSRVEVRRGSLPVLLARLPAASDTDQPGADARIGAPFTDRLVAKFGLPVSGWRGRSPERSGSGAGGNGLAREAISERADEESGGGHA